MAFNFLKVALRPRWAEPIFRCLSHEHRHIFEKWTAVKQTLWKGSYLWCLPSGPSSAPAARYFIGWLA